MLKFGFNDYEGFKEIFGLKEGADGMYRPNKILLAFLKDKNMLKYKDAWGVKNMNMLFEFVERKMLNEKDNLHKPAYEFNEQRTPWSWVAIGNWKCFVSDVYETDGQHGVCEDGDFRSFRYVLKKTGRTYKMKFSKMFNHLIMLTPFGKELPEQVRLWYIEEKCRWWETYCKSQVPDYEFHYGDGEELNKIYNKRLQRGDFHSCMNSSDGMHGDFYKQSVKAMAAYLTSKDDGRMIARCVVFPECEDCETGEIVRLAERQYSTDINELLKRCLVNELIKRNLIDGYKRVGADCHSARNFVSNDGADWSGRKFKIRCSLESGDVNAYMDSFKWYNEYEGYCYNDERMPYDYELTDTSDYWREDEGNYDTFYEEYVREDLHRVYCRGTEHYIAESRLDGGDWVHCDSDNEYHYYEDVSTCDECGETYDSWSNNYYSDITGYDYCCENCRDAAEEEYKKEHWYYSEYDGKYYEDVDDVVDVINEDGESTTIHIETLKELIEDGKAVLNENDDYVLC